MDFFQYKKNDQISYILDIPIEDIKSDISLKEFSSQIFSQFTAKLLSGSLNNCFNMTQDSVLSKYAEFRLGRGAENTLVLRVIEGDYDKITPHQYISANDSIIQFFGSGTCTATLYSFEEQDNYDIFDKNRRLAHKESLILKGGDTIRIRAGVDALRLHNSHELAVAELSSIKHHSIVWNFNAQTGQLLFPSSSELESSRLCMMLDLLAVLGDKSCIPALKQRYTASLEHFVKWKIIETASQVDDELTKELLIKAKSDAHPHLRNAAIESLRLNGL